jgi:hypothetical protein
VPQPPDPGREVDVDLVEGSAELLAGRRFEILDAGEGDSGFGEGADLDQVDGVLRGVAAVAGGVTAGFWQESFVVVDADGLGRHAGVPGELAGARGDLDELNELLDEGSSRAGHLLTRRAVKAGDLLELQRLADAGCGEAGGELERLLARPADTGED